MQMTAIAIASNEIENIKMMVKSFRLFCDTELSLIIIDNGSTDGLREWAKEQTDLTYVLLEEHVSYGKALNMVIRELEIDTDLLLIGSSYLLTPGCLQRLSRLLYQEEAVGAAGGVYNLSNLYQDIPGEIIDYQTAVAYADKWEGCGKRRVLTLQPGVTLWKKEVWQELGDFEEITEGAVSVIRDYCMRAVIAGYDLMVCQDAWFWDMRSSNIELFHREYVQEQREKKLLEEKWNTHYFNGTYNQNLVRHVEGAAEANLHVLEIGCDCGGTLLEIKNRFPNADLYGTEINRKAAEIAGRFARVEINNIEEKQLPFGEGVLFDYIIFGDVLEHLHDPKAVLEYCRGLLREGGKIIASIPNVMHISVMEQLLKGNFTYTETGLLDKTHVHLFTYYEIQRMFSESGYELCATESVTMPMDEGEQQLIDKLLALGNGTARFMYETFQYVIVAEKSFT